MRNTTDLLIANRFDEGKTDIEGLIAPLRELAQESSSLIVGYAPTGSGRREDAIPYFHICGSSSEHPPVRVLLVGGWFGTEIRSPYTIARLIAGMETQLSRAQGLEVTAFPVANLDAHRAGTYFAAGQSSETAVCWEESSIPHVKVMEKELLRHPYDVVIFLRENPRSIETDAEAWLVEQSHKQTLGAILEAHRAAHEGFRWSMSPPSPNYRRTFTPLPKHKRQPSEIIIGLSAAMPADTMAREVSDLLLPLLDALRAARAKGEI